MPTEQCKFNLLRILTVWTGKYYVTSSSECWFPQMIILYYCNAERYKMPTLTMRFLAPRRSTANSQTDARNIQTFRQYNTIINIIYNYYTILIDYASAIRHKFNNYQSNIVFRSNFKDLRKVVLCIIIYWYAFVIDAEFT